jgi:hypothetical protein
LLMRNNPLDQIHKHQKRIHFQSKSSPLTGRGAQCIRRSDYRIGNAIFSSRTERWR